jgi:hypothetical protein
MRGTHSHSDIFAGTHLALRVAFGLMHVDKFPDDTFARPITPEMKDRVGLFAIQALNRVA